MNSYPSIYDPARIGTLFYPDIAAITAAASAANLPPAAADSETVHLVIIDMQIDFCHAQGTLFVPGAQQDMQNLIEFIYANAAKISKITCSLDSHLPHQIFHSAWWADADGNHPAPFTLISHADVESGRWRPLMHAAASKQYVQRLEAEAKKTLTIWPYHVLMGSIGNALDPELFTAILWHSLARKSEPAWLSKGMIPLTEHYSIIQPEVPVPTHPQGGKNRAFLETLLAADRLIVAGEAESHCVLETVSDLVEAFQEQGAPLDKIIFLQDCTSPVQHPEVDFHALAMAELTKFAQQGLQFADSKSLSL